MKGTRLRARAVLAASFVVAAWGVGSPAPSWAQGNALDQAKKLFEVGAQSYSAGQYDAAIQAFEQAYRLAPRPALLFSLAQAERKHYHVTKSPEHVARALAHYRQYLDQVPTGGRRSDATDAIADLEPIAARLGVEGSKAGPTREVAPTRLSVGTQTQGALVSIDDGPKQAAPFSEVVKPGKHHVRVEAPGFVAEEQDVVAVEGSLVPVTVDLRERPALVTFATDDGADIYVDGRLVGTTPLPRPLELSSGEHFVSVAKTGSRAVAFPVTLERAKERRIPVRLERTPQRFASYIVLGGGAAGLVAGGVFSGFALAAESRATGLEEQGQTGNLTPEQRDEHNRAIEERDQWRTAASATFAVSAGLLVVGAALYVLDKPTLAAPAPTERPPEKPTTPSTSPMMELSFSPIVGPSSWGGAAVGRF